MLNLVIIPCLGSPQGGLFNGNPKKNNAQVLSLGKAYTFEPSLRLSTKNSLFSEWPIIPYKNPKSQVWRVLANDSFQAKMCLMKVKKAVIPAAGFGTRFLPITKTIPKEMLPVLDKPIIQIVVEELVDAGIEEIIIVTKGDKKVLENYFKPNPRLDKLLRDSGKSDIADSLKKIEKLASFRFIKQKGKSGNAVPIHNSLKYIGNEPFLVFWGDDFVVASPSRAKQLIKAYDKYRGVVLGAIRTSKEEDTLKYGYAKGKMVSGHVMDVESVIEKPGPGKAPSELATVSGFLITPEAKPFFAKAIKEVEGREPCYLDAIDRMLMAGKGKCYALELSNAKYYDTGSKIGYLEAIMQFALKSKEYGLELKKRLNL